MTYEERKQFVDELINNVKIKIQNDTTSANIPEEWDGTELRWLIRERFNDVVWGSFNDKRKSRYKKFKNYCIVNNI